MRITVDIDEKVLRAVCDATGTPKKSPAVGHALKAYLKQRKKKALIQRVMEGRTDYRTTNEELEERSSYDVD